MHFPQNLPGFSQPLDPAKRLLESFSRKYIAVNSLPVEGYQEAWLGLFYTTGAYYLTPLCRYYYELLPRCRSSYEIVLERLRKEAY